MKACLNSLVRRINEKGHLGSLGLADDGKTFIVSNIEDEACFVETILYGKLLPQGIFDIKEIVYDSAQITDVMCDTDKDIVDYLKRNYDINTDY